MQEQVAKVATSVVENFRSQPLMLLVLLINFGVLLLIYFGTRQTLASQAELIKTLIANCTK